MLGSGRCYKTTRKTIDNKLWVQIGPSKFGEKLLKSSITCLRFVEGGDCNQQQQADHVKSVHFRTSPYAAIIKRWGFASLCTVFVTNLARMLWIISSTSMLFHLSMYSRNAPRNNVRSGIMDLRWLRPLRTTAVLTKGYTFCVTGQTYWFREVGPVYDLWLTLLSITFLMYHGDYLFILTTNIYSDDIEYLYDLLLIWGVIAVVNGMVHRTRAWLIGNLDLSGIYSVIINILCFFVAPTNCWRNGTICCLFPPSSHKSL